MAAATRPPTAAELQQAARAMLLGQRLPGPALQPDALTHGLCADLLEALEVALQSPEVIAYHQGRPGTRVRMLGLVAATLVGHPQAELREPAALDMAGKRLAKIAKDHRGKMIHSKECLRIQCQEERQETLHQGPGGGGPGGAAGGDRARLSG